MNTEVNLAGIKMKNPVTVASGTFGYGREFSELIDLNKLRRNCDKGNSNCTMGTEINHQEYVRLLQECLMQ